MDNVAIAQFQTERAVTALERIATAQERIAAVLTEQTKIGGALNAQDIARILSSIYKYMPTGGRE